MEALKKFVNGYVSVPSKDWEAIEPYFIRQEVPKNTCILKEGSVCRRLYFVENGLLRFFVVKDGLEMTKFFTIAPYFFTSQVSFNSGVRANESIETIERSIIWSISHKDNEQLLQLNSWNMFARKLTQEVQFFTEEILEALQSETAEARYRKLLATQPDLLNRIPLKHLATFYGVAPQSLSRIRKKIAAECKS